VDPRLWVYLDNLRQGLPPATALMPDQVAWAAAEARIKGFVSDAPFPDRLTRVGEIALRRSLSQEGEGTA
jgi:hypothetical protein